MATRLFVLNVLHVVSRSKVQSVQILDRASREVSENCLQAAMYDCLHFRAIRAGQAIGLACCLSFVFY